MLMCHLQACTTSSQLPLDEDSLPFVVSGSRLMPLGSPSHACSTKDHLLPPDWLSLKPPCCQNIQGWATPKEIPQAKRPKHYQQEETIFHEYSRSFLPSPTVSPVRHSLASLPPRPLPPVYLDHLPEAVMTNVCGRLGSSDWSSLSKTSRMLYVSTSMAQRTLRMASHPGDATLSSILLRFRKLQRLDLGLRPNGTPLAEASFRVLAGSPCGPHLTFLSLSKQPQLNDEGLKFIAQSFPGLEILDLTGCTAVTNTGLAEASGRLGKLRELKVGYCKGVTSVGLEAVAENCHQLTKLEISEKAGFEGKWGEVKELTVNCDACECNKTIASIANSCPKLESLTLKFCCGVGDMLPSIRLKCPNLSSLTLESCTGITPNIFHLPWPSLTRLFIHSSGVLDSTLEMVGRGCPGLKELSLHSCADITDDGLNRLALQCKKLEYLDVGQCSRITHSELVYCAAGRTPALLKIVLPRQCFGAKHLKAVSKHGWHLDSSSLQWQLVRKALCRCLVCRSKAGL